MALFSWYTLPFLSLNSSSDSINIFSAKLPWRNAVMVSIWSIFKLWLSKWSNIESMYTHNWWVYFIVICIKFCEHPLATNLVLWRTTSPFPSHFVLKTYLHFITFLLRGKSTSFQITFFSNNFNSLLMAFSIFPGHFFQCFFKY